MMMKVKKIKMDYEMLTYMGKNRGGENFTSP